MPSKFKPSNYAIEVVGESNYQNTLRECSMYKELVDKNDLEHSLTMTASLILENENKFDPNAVRIDIEEKPVGYLSREDAIKYRKALSKLNLKDEYYICKASVHGKRERSGQKMLFGVWLYIDINNLALEEPRKKLFGIF